MNNELQPPRPFTLPGRGESWAGCIPHMAIQPALSLPVDAHDDEDDALPSSDPPRMFPIWSVRLFRCVSLALNLDCVPNRLAFRRTASRIQFFLRIFALVSVSGHLRGKV